MCVVSEFCFAASFAVVVRVVSHSTRKLKGTRTVYICAVFRSEG